MNFFSYASLVCSSLLWVASSAVAGVNCSSTSLGALGGAANAVELSDGGIAAFSKLNINIDGYGRSYHLKDQSIALIHLCNAGRVYKPDGSSYEGSESNATCTGRFMTDVAAIQAAGWKDPAVGVVNWYGILGGNSATIRGKNINNVIPVMQKDGSGFAVSPTKLSDLSISDATDQSKYVNPLRIPAAVAPRSLVKKGVAMGSFGVVYNTKTRKAVPFVVGDVGPRIGEGSLALARLASGFPLKDDIKRSDRYAGQVDRPIVLWVFFGREAARFDSRNEQAIVEKSRAAFEEWGGEARLQACVASVPRN